jgi:hypothetical protein
MPLFFDHLFGAAQECDANEAEERHIADPIKKLKLKRFTNPGVWGNGFVY